MAQNTTNLNGTHQERLAGSSSTFQRPYTDLIPSIKLALTYFLNTQKTPESFGISMSLCSEVCGQFLHAWQDCSAGESW